MKRTKTVLIIKEDELQSSLVEPYLRKDGWRTLVVGEGQSYMRILGDDPPNLAILEPGTQSVYAEYLCRKIRERSHVPIIVVVPLKSDWNPIGVLGYIPIKCRIRSVTVVEDWLSIIAIRMYNSMGGR